MRGIKTPFEHAEEVKRYLIEHDLFDRKYSHVKREDGIVFPVTREFSPPFDFDVEFITLVSDEREQTTSLRIALQGLLSEEEMDHLRTSFDTVGDIAIIDVMPELESKEKLIGETLLEHNKNIKTVLKKTGPRGGDYRTQSLECIAGVDTRETMVVENGITLKVDVEDAYYSVRMATERRRILRQILPGENILCLFSGVGPYPILFSRFTDAKTIVGIEINPLAHQLAVENVAKNRCTNVRLLQGDAHDIVPKLAENDEEFDRITMPLPHAAEEFLDDALSVSKKGTIIHFYTFLHDGDFDSIIPVLQEAFEKNRRKLGSCKIVRAGQHAPRVWRVCVDAEVQ